MSAAVKLTLFARSGKITATYSFAAREELQHFLELNKPLRYTIWG